MYHTMWKLGWLDIIRSAHTYTHSMTSVSLLANTLTEVLKLVVRRIMNRKLSMESHLLVFCFVQVSLPPLGCRTVNSQVLLPVAVDMC